MYSSVILVKSIENGKLMLHNIILKNKPKQCHLFVFNVLSKVSKYSICTFRLSKIRDYKCYKEGKWKRTNFSLNIIKNMNKIINIILCFIIYFKKCLADSYPFCSSVISRTCSLDLNIFSIRPKFLSRIHHFLYA